MKLLSVAAAYACLISTATLAQTVCQGGTGSSLLAIGATPTPVCMGGSAGTRTMLNIMNSGPANLLCSWETTVPLTATTYDFVVYAGGEYNAAQPGWVPTGVVTCMAASGTTAIKATVNQGGTP